MFGKTPTILSLGLIFCSLKKLYILFTDIFNSDHEYDLLIPFSLKKEIAISLLFFLKIFSV